jgi:putative ABC transport system permease protein
MTRQQLMMNSLMHYWRTNLAVMLGVVVGTAVIGGALIVGESVRASLRKMTFDRLGQVEFVLSGPRFFREELAGEIQIKDRSVAPAIIMRAAMQAKSNGTSRRAGQVSVYGIDHGVWSLIDVGNVQQPAGTGVVLNTQVAEALHAKVGDQVTLWIEIPSAVPRDTLLGNKDNDSQEITLTVSGIAPADNGLSRFGLNPVSYTHLRAHET